jgi:hypothetical protein
MKDKIPAEFLDVKGDHIPQAQTVGDLIKQLERLPKDLPLCGSDEGHVHELVVYNSPNLFLKINEVHYS